MKKLPKEINDQYDWIKIISVRQFLIMFVRSGTLLIAKRILLRC